MDLVAAAQFSFPVACTDAILLSNCSAHMTEMLLADPGAQIFLSCFFGFLYFLSFTSTLIFCCFWFSILDYFHFFDMILVAQPRHAFACAKGRGKTGVTVIMTGWSLRLFDFTYISDRAPTNKICRRDAIDRPFRLFDS